MSESINPLQLVFRMYILVPYNISPIQQGIQAAHAIVEYGNLNNSTKEYRKWADFDKTIIVLNGGTTNDDNGTLNSHHKTLLKHGVTTATFHEPDLNDTLTGVAFLVDERIFDKKKYPNPQYVTVNCSDADSLRELYPGKYVPEDCWVSKEFQDLTGSYSNAFLRGFLQDFRLA